MNLIGFKDIGEFDCFFLKSKHVFEEKEEDFIIISDDERKKIEVYLLNSTVIFTALSIITLSEKDYVPYILRSDGAWIWSCYFWYYLQKDRKINVHFLNHIRSQAYTPVLLIDEEKNKVSRFIEIELARYGSFRSSIKIKIPENNGYE
jgi:hypothetical protein